MGPTEPSEVVALFAVLPEQENDSIVVGHREVDHALALLQELQRRTRADLVIVLEGEDGDGDRVPADELSTGFGEL